MSALEGRSDLLAEPEPAHQPDDNALSWREIFHFPSPWVCSVTYICIRVLLLSLEPYTSPPLLVPTKITVSVCTPGRAPELCVIHAARNAGWHSQPCLLDAVSAALFSWCSDGSVCFSGSDAHFWDSGSWI